MPPAPEYRLVPRDDLPGLLSLGRSEGLKCAVQASLRYLEARKPGEEFKLGDRTVTVEKLRLTLDSFLSLLDEHLPSDELRVKIQERFLILEVIPGNGGTGGSPVLVTGYFQPVLKASYSRTSDFNYPLYGVPEDLVQVRLRQFGEKMPDQVIWGRVDGHRLVPYYTREEIDSGGRPLSAPVLAYLSSPVEGLMLQIQGSGVLEFPDGSRRFIHYAASNGRPYRSIGRWLIEHQILDESQADWPGIRKWAEENPDAFLKVAARNPRYVFFKWEVQGPVGSMGQVLTPLVSVAMDPEVYPLSCLCFLEVPLPMPESTKEIRAFVLNQDTGSAIKGPFRLDFYCGQGNAAGEVAGRLRNRGRLFVLLARD